MDIERYFEVRIVNTFSKFYGKYGGGGGEGGSTAVYKLYKKTDVFRQDNVPNDCCHDNFDEIFCNLYDNYDRNY